MGDMTEMIMDGLMCSQCGEWMDDFDEPGYPRVCEDCVSEQIKNDKKGANKNGNE